MPSNDRLLDYYERELAYLRSAGEAFAQQHPKVAQRLELSGDESPDPHVERLLEAFAFLAARIHQNIDDSTSDVANNLLEQLYPHALRPVPSSTIARFEPDQAKINLDAGYTVERGTSLFTHSSQGDTVYFKTCYPVSLWPLRISSVSLQTEDLRRLTSQSSAASVLKVGLVYPNGFAFPEGGAAALLRFYLKGSSDTSAQLLDLLLGNTIEVSWHADRATEDNIPPVLPDVQRDVRPRYVGLEAGQGLLPEQADSHPAFRLLLEYFAFPAKFQFVDVDCARLSFMPKGVPPPAGANAAQETEGELLFVFDAKPPRQLLLDPDSLQLGCTPVINLFPRTAEPLRITARQAHYKLVADHHRHRSTEIYTIERVQANGAGASAASDLPAYFAFRPHTGSAAHAGPYWHARRISNTSAGLAGSDIQLTFVDPNFDPATDAGGRTLNAQVLCTNRQLARQLDAGAVLHIEAAGPIAAVRALHKPTAQVQPSLDGAARWNLVSQLALNQMSLVDGEAALAALGEMLSLNNLTQELAAERQVKGLVGMRSQRVTRHTGSDPWYAYRHGYSVRVRLDPQLFRGSSQMLFCAVLHRFLGRFAGINTFVELVLEDNDKQARHSWAALPVAYVNL